MSSSSHQLIQAIRKGDSAALHRLREEADGEALSVDGATFKGVQLLGLDLSGLDLSNTEWEDCLLDDVRFEGTDLQGAYIHGSTLLNCRFANSVMSGLAVEGCIVRRAHIEDVDASGSEVSDTQFSESVFITLDIADAEWSGVTLNQGEIKGLTGEGASLNRWTLREVEVSAFKTANMTLEHCSFAPREGGEKERPEGFNLLSGRRRRV